MSKYHGAILFVKGDYNIIVKLDVCDNVPDMVKKTHGAFPTVVSMGVDSFATVYHSDDVPYAISWFDVQDGFCKMRLDSI